MKKIILIIIITFVNMQVLFSQDENTYQVRNVNINDNNSNIGISFYSDDFIVFSSQNKSKKEQKSRQLKKTKRLYDLNFNFGLVDDFGDILNSQKLSEEVNSNYDEIDLVFTNDFETVYFTRSTRNSKTELFKADVITLGFWKNIVKLPFNSEKYSYGHPCLSEDNKTLYFASNMKGTLGGFDIFRVSILSNNTYGNPINLGNRINTSKNETTPYIYDNTLYFSSNGRKGFGGLDIYYTSLDNMSIITNIGESINSSKDDLSYIKKISDDGLSDFGFFASNRSGGKGNNDIYYFSKLVENPIIPEDIVNSEKNNKDKDIVSFYKKNSSNTYIKSLNNKSLSKTEIANLDKRKAQLDILPTKAIEFRNLNSNNNTVAKNISSHKHIDHSVPKSENLIPVKKVDLNSKIPNPTITVTYREPRVINDNTPVVTNTEPQVVTTQPNKAVNFRNLNSNNPAVTYTEPQVVTTEPNKAVNFRNLNSNNPAVTYTEPQVITTEPYKASNFRNLNSNNPAVTYTEPQVITTEPYKASNFRNLNSNNTVTYSSPVTTTYSSSNVISSTTYSDSNDYSENEFDRCQYQLDEINNIYFDLNKDHIRPDAADELYKVISILNYCPNVNIVVSSYTDSRGKRTYNLDLSQRRADNSVKFLIENGFFAPERLKGVGYGEERLKNRCSNGVPCSKNEHQTNRRTQIEITNF